MSDSASKCFYPKGFPELFLGNPRFSVDMLNGQWVRLNPVSQHIRLTVFAALVAVGFGWSSRVISPQNREGDMAFIPPDAKPAPEFPAAGFPVAFADTITSFANSATTVKFYFGRWEPDMNGSGNTKLAPFAQVVMPMEGFMAAFAFLEERINLLIKQGVVDQRRLNEMRDTIAAAQPK